MCNINDERIEKENLIHVNKGKCNNFGTYTDGKNLIFCKTTDPRVLSGEIIHINKGRKHTPEMIKHKIGKSVYVLPSGETKTLKNDDPLVISGHATHINKGRRPSDLTIDKLVENSIGHSNYISTITGEIQRLKLNDPRIKTDEFININKGMSVFVDKNGNRIRCSTKDPRVLSGELISNAIGKKQSQESIEKRNDTRKNKKYKLTQSKEVFEMTRQEIIETLNIKTIPNKFLKGELEISNWKCLGPV